MKRRQRRGSGEQGLEKREQVPRGPLFPSRAEARPAARGPTLTGQAGAPGQMTTLLEALHVWVYYRTRLTRQHADLGLFSSIGGQVAVPFFPSLDLATRGLSPLQCLLADPIAWLFHEPIPGLQQDGVPGRLDQVTGPKL